MVLPGTIEKYSMEELTAEMGACHLKSFCGIEEWNFQNRFEYVDGWLKVLRNDKRLLVYASAQAQLVVDYILNLRNGSTQNDFNENRILQTIAI